MRFNFICGYIITNWTKLKLEYFLFNSSKSSFESKQSDKEVPLWPPICFKYLGKYCYAVLLFRLNIYEKSSELNSLWTISHTYKLITIYNYYYTIYYIVHRKFNIPSLVWRKPFGIEVVMMVVKRSFIHSMCNFLELGFWYNDPLIRILG